VVSGVVSARQREEATVTFRRRTRIAVGALIVGMIGAAAASGYSMAPSVNVPRGGHATFLQSGWRCNNYGSRVLCLSGDARPYAELTSTRRGGNGQGLHAPRSARWSHDAHVRPRRSGLRLYCVLGRRVTG
jgi:hypothetical protein